MRALSGTNFLRSLFIILGIYVSHIPACAQNPQNGDRATNGLTIEALGNNAIPSLSINYHHFFPLRCDTTIETPFFQLALRAGIGVVKYNSAPMNVLLPAEVSILLGRKRFTPEIGFGYTAVLGKIDIRTSNTVDGVVRKSMIDFMLCRVGVQFRSDNFARILFRIAWTPRFYLTHNPLSIDENSILDHRLEKWWGGASLGIVF